MSHQQVTGMSWPYSAYSFASSREHEAPPKLATDAELGFTADEDLRPALSGYDLTRFHNAMLLQIARNGDRILKKLNPPATEPTE